MPARELTGKPISDGDSIVLIGPAGSSPQWAGIAGGARRFVAGYPPLTLETMAPADNTSAALSQVVREALAKGPKAICLYVSDPDAARPAARQITRRGRILVTMGVGGAVPDAFGHVSVACAGGAELLGERLEDIAGGKHSYVLLHRHGATNNDTHCYERFMLKARSSHGMTLLDERNAAESEQSPTELLREMFARFQHAGLAVTLDPRTWLSTPPDKLLGSNARFVTLGAPPVLWQYLRSGEAAALVGPLDGEIGSLAAEMAVMGITESQKPGQVRIVQMEVVKAETLGDFASRYAAAAGLDLKDLFPPSAPALPEGASDAKVPP
jgi:ABC-type sugar transport system substrate-binding protein